MNTLGSRSKNQIHYFTLNSDYRKLPIHSVMVLSSIKKMRFSALLIMTQFLQNFLFFLICKVGNSQIYLVGLITFLCMSGLSSFLSRKEISKVHSKTSLAFMGLLDIVYFYILLGTGSGLTSFAFATQLQGTLFIRVILLKFVLQQNFYYTQYLGACTIAVGCILNFVYFGDRYTYLLLLGMFLHCINNIIKRHYIKKFFVAAENLNKFVFVFATGFGILITPLLSLVATGDVGGDIKNEIMCLVGVKCFLMPVYLFLLLLTTILHQYLLKKSSGEIEGQKVVYMFSCVFVFLAFYCAEVTVGDQNISIYKIICLVLALVGSVMYHLYPEIPQKFSYSDN